MGNLRARVAKLKRQHRQPIVVGVQRGETEEEALARAGIIPAELHPSQLLVIVNRYRTVMTHDT